MTGDRIRKGGLPRPIIVISVTDYYLLCTDRGMNENTLFESEYYWWESLLMDFLGSIKGVFGLQDALGGSKNSVMAKIRYTIRSRKPTNHADRPVLVTAEAVIVAMSIITTAPGQNRRSIGAGPKT